MSRGIVKTELTLSSESVSMSSIYCEELAVQREENHAQHQLMNIMMMAILNRNNEPKNISTSNDSPVNN